MEKRRFRFSKDELSKESFTLKRILEDSKLRLRQERLLEFWQSMSDSKVQIYFDKNLRSQYNYAKAKRIPYTFKVKVFLLHIAYRINI